MKTAEAIGIHPEFILHYSQRWLTGFFTDILNLDRIAPCWKHATAIEVSKPEIISRLHVWRKPVIVAMGAVSIRSNLLAAFIEAGLQNILKTSTVFVEAD